jgi:hypothetical protein
MELVKDDGKFDYRDTKNTRNAGAVERIGKSQAPLLCKFIGKAAIINILFSKYFLPLIT